jgi:hypothetical protein
VAFIAEVPVRRAMRRVVPGALSRKLREVGICGQVPSFGLKRGGHLECLRAVDVHVVVDVHAVLDGPVGPGNPEDILNFAVAFLNRLERRSAEPLPDPGDDWDL